MSNDRPADAIHRKLPLALLAVFALLVGAAGLVVGGMLLPISLVYDVPAWRYWPYPVGALAFSVAAVLLLPEPSD